MTTYHRDPLRDMLVARPHPWAHFRRAISGWLADKRLRRVRRRSLLSLAHMENWQLRDLGLSREEVERIIAAGARVGTGTQIHKDR